jgi:hypothetical protein
MKNIKDDIEINLDPHIGAAAHTNFFPFINEGLWLKTSHTLWGNAGLGMLIYDNIYRPIHIVINEYLPINYEL